MRRCLVVKRAASSCQMWTQRHVYLQFVQKQPLKTSSSFNLKTTTTTGWHSNGTQPQQHYTHSLIHCELCVTGVEVVAKRLSVLVHGAFPAFSIFKLIIYYNDYLNINNKQSTVWAYFLWSPRCHTNTNQRGNRINGITNRIILDSRSIFQQPQLVKNCV